MCKKAANQIGLDWHGCCKVEGGQNSDFLVVLSRDAQWRETAQGNPPALEAEKSEFFRHTLSSANLEVLGNWWVV